MSKTKEPARLASPTPAQVKARRQGAALTQAQAAALLHTSLRSYQQWEAEQGAPGHRAMHPAVWELFCIKTSTFTGAQ